MTEEEKERVCYRVGDEGLDYTFRFYSNYEEIKDKEFHKLRQNYIKASTEMLVYLGIEGKL